MYNFLLYALVTMLLLGSCNAPQKDNHQEKEGEQKKASAPALAPKTIVFYGNSITAGYGLEISEAFPALIQKKLDSLGYSYKVINAGLSGETSAGGISRLNWILKQKVDIFVLELGANDGLRGIPPSHTKKNLEQIISTVKSKYPEVVIILAGMQMPPSMGTKFTTEFREVYKQLAKENNLPIIPFILEGVGGHPRLNLPDGVHPTAEGHKIIANNVWTVLKDKISKP